MKRNLIISMILNSLISIFTVVATIMMFTGFKFMHGVEPVLEVTAFGMFKFFTVDSNIYMGIIALVFLVEELKLYKGKIKEISHNMYLLKLIGTVGVALTCFVVFSYLGFIVDGGVMALLRNSNLFYHLLTPVLSIITFIFFEKNDKLVFKDSFYGILGTAIYGIYYIINVLIHVDKGMVSPDYDWYYFVQKGVWTALIVVPIIYLITYIISFLLYKINKIRK